MILSAAHPTLSARIATTLRQRTGSVIALALLLAVLALVMTTTIRSPQKDDVAWLLYVARRWLGGQRLYEDLVEVNPPLIVWIYAMPAWLAGITGAAPKLIAIPFFAVLVLAAAWWSACLLRGRAALFAHRAPVFAVISIILLVLPGVEFGQREHLMAASILPYLCVMAGWLADAPGTRRYGRGASIAAGIAAGLGCAFKPTYALAFLLPEILGLVQGRRLFRLAPISAFLAAAIYGLLVIVLCPAFLERAVPLALALYGGTDTALVDLLIAAWTLLVGVGVTLVLWATTHRLLAARSPFTASLFAVLVTFAVGATAVYVLQGKDWFYHRIPATMATVLALVLWGVEMWPLMHAALARRLVPLAALAMVALAGITYTGVDRMRPWIEEAVEPELSTEVRLEKIIKRENAHTYIAFSEWIGLGFPVVNNTGVVWTSRFDSMWALRGEMWRARQDGRPPADWPIRRWVARDFVNGCPDIAVVDARGGINFVAILVASDAAFAQAWTHYQQIATFNGLRVLKRQGATCTDANIRPRIAATAFEAP